MTNRAARELNTRIVGPHDYLLNREAVTPAKLEQYGCASLYALAKKAGISRTTLTRAYTGAVNVGTRLLVGLHNATGLPLEKIIETYDKPTVIYLPGHPDYDPGDYPQITASH